MWSKRKINCPAMHAVISIVNLTTRTGHPGIFVVTAVSGVLLDTSYPGPASSKAFLFTTALQITKPNCTTATTKVSTPIGSQDHWIPKLSAHNRSISCVPAIIADCSPFPIGHYFNSSRIDGAVVNAIHKSDMVICTRASV